MNVLCKIKNLLVPCSNSHSGSACRYNFGKASTLGGARGATTDATPIPIGEYAAYITRASVDTYTEAVFYKGAQKWYQALDLEIINSLKETLYTGISTKGSTNTLRLNVGNALAAVTHAVHFFSCFDVILEFDYANQIINVIQ